MNFNTPPIPQKQNEHEGQLIERGAFRVFPFAPHYRPRKASEADLPHLVTS